VVIALVLSVLALVIALVVAVLGRRGARTVSAP